jgi:cell division protein FtsI (penicillin-binding protein 3)
MLQNTGYVCRTLASVTGRPADEYLAKIEKARAAGSSFVWLERAIDSPASVMTSQLDSLEDDGVIKTREPRRSFAYGALAAQALGFTDAENKGASGIEIGWDSVLAGRAGYMYLQRDGRGKKRPSPDVPAKEPQTGNSLVLTLDMDIQSIIESELVAGVQSAQAESGVAIAVRPATGEILAMASVPSFNPNRLSNATPEVTRNRCFTDMYEPGSTFKLITSAALIDEHRIRPNDAVSGSASQIPRGVTIRDEHPFESAPFYRAVELSSNIVMAALAQRMPSPKFYKYVRDFGFGIYSGIDIPGEVRGIVKKPHEFDNTTKIFMAHGYELAATPLQIVNAYATIANGGVMMRPYIVERVISPEGNDVHVTTPQKVRRVVAESTATTLTQVFCGVVERGTGTPARIKGMAIAGKTGTAQRLRDGKYSKEDYTTSFAGYFPADKPEIALLVILNNPRNGYYSTQVVAPIFQKIAQKLVSSGLVSAGSGLGVIPNSGSVPALQDNPTFTLSSKEASKETSKETSKELKDPDNASTSTNTSSTTIVVPDLRGLPYQSAVESARNLGLTLKPNVAGGVVQSQKPKAGTVLKARSTTTTPEMVIAVQTTQPDITVDALPNSTIPNVRGMTLRRALTLLHAANIKTKVVGQGSTVARQEFKDGRDPVCTLYCQ